MTSLPAKPPPILVQFADHAWTFRALRAACPLAHERGAAITLLRLTPVHPASLGAANWTLDSGKDHRFLAECAALAKSYGVPLVVRRMQYTHLENAILDAADYLNAEFVFATLPPSLLPWWRARQLRQMQRHLNARRRHLCTLESPAAESV